MTKRHLHITKLQSELIQKKELIDHKLDEAIAKHCYLKKSKYELLPSFIPKIQSHMKCMKLSKIPNIIQHTVPLTSPNTTSKAALHNIITKTPVSTTQKGNFQRMSKQVVMYKFHNEIHDAEVLKADCD